MNLDELFGSDPEEVAARPTEDDADGATEEPDPEETEDGEPSPGQATLFGADDDFHVAWREWRGMPEFSQDDLTPVRQIIVNFASLADVKRFAELVEQRVGPKTRSLWYPAAEIGHFKDKRYADVEGSDR